MLYEDTAKSVLHQLGIGKSYKGYNYILYGIHLISQDESRLYCITKVLYIDIAKEHHTSSICVEKNMRTIIEVIWRKTRENKQLILNIFGSRYASVKPSNKEFLELLYEYIKSHNLIYRLIHADKFICPISKDVCVAYTKIIESLIDLE